MIKRIVFGLLFWTMLSSTGYAYTVDLVGATARNIDGIHLFAQTDPTIYDPVTGTATHYTCGAATARMLMDGYKAEADLPSEMAIYSTLGDSVNNSIRELNVEGNRWYSDPFGIQQTIYSLGGTVPAVAGYDSGYFAIGSRIDRNQAIYTTLWWMDHTQLPAGVLTYRGNHWMAMVGFETNASPITTYMPELSTVHLFDPASAAVGNKTVTGVTWCDLLDNYWGNPANSAILNTTPPNSQWYNMYVGIADPPLVEGSIELPDPPMILAGGGASSLLSPEDAKTMAISHISTFKLYDRYPKLKQTDMVPGTPLLVRQTDNNRQYYIVPFSYEGESAAPINMMLNADDGSFREINEFVEPITYLSKDQATGMALQQEGGLAIGTATIPVEVVLDPSKDGQSNSWVMWRATINGKTVDIQPTTVDEKNKWTWDTVWNQPSAPAPQGGARLTRANRSVNNGQEAQFQMNIKADVFPYLEAWLVGKEIYWEVTQPDKTWKRAAAYLLVQANTAYKITISNVNPLICRSTGDTISTYYWLERVGGHRDDETGNGINLSTMTIEQIGAICSTTLPETVESPAGEMVFSEDFEEISKVCKGLPFNPDKVNKKAKEGNLFVPAVEETDCDYSLYGLGAGLVIGPKVGVTETGNSYNGKDNQGDKYTTKGGQPIITVSAYLP
ncbi:hypothetical protein HY792_06500 [Candidatus Desantisbacteria bacterium]|nr:hypothetical protein [Candidatus Desantisbacteria bacterium]